MKRFMVFIIMIFSMLLLFGIANQSDSSFVIKGYYLDSSGQSLILSISDIAGSKLYETSALVGDSNIGADGKIFIWSLTGNSNNTTTLKFTFSQLQAYSNKVYYRPSYEIKMVQNASSTVNNRSDSFYSSTVRTVVNATKATSDYEYTTTSVVTYTGKVNSNNGNVWERSGYCTLNIKDYDKSQGSFEYKCRVTVEYTTE